MNKELCFWSIGDGECALMLQKLVDSFRKVGMKEDFHVFSDRPIEGAITHLVEPFDKRGFLFKFAFLQSKVVNLDYRYFVYLDSDTLFMRKPPPLIPLLKESPLHLFLETSFFEKNIRKEWWHCPIDQHIAMLRDCGVVSRDIYGLNSGFFIIKKEAIPIVCGLAQDFFEYAHSHGYFFPDEPLWVYAMHMLCDDPEKHLLRDHFDVWGTDWKGVFVEKLPDGKPWRFYDYMTDEGEINTDGSVELSADGSVEINPAIVHALRSKKLLVKHEIQSS